MITAAFEKYAAYKDSGIEWLEDVPAHWDEKRLKDIAVLERGKFTHRPRTDPRMYEGKHPFIQTGAVARANKYITNYEQTLSDQGIKVSKLFKKGTLLMAIAANIGDVAIVDFDTYLPDSIVGFRPRKNDTDYLYYLLLVTKAELDTVKVTSTQDNLNLERLNSLIKFLPPLPEQRAIADYLDRKTAQIDRKIDTLTRKAEQYGQLKQSLINETVTRGLDKSVAMKDSGVEWIGEIPAHWDLVSVKRLAGNQSNVVQTGPFGAQLHASDYVDEGVPLILIRNVKDLWIDDSNIPRIMEEKATALSMYRLEIGDIVFSRVGSIGRIALITRRERGWMISGQMLRLRIKNHLLDKQYLVYAFSADFVSNYIKLQSIGSTRESINTEILRNCTLIIPPLPEQKAIADYLDTQTAHTDRIIETIHTKIEKLRELRKTLINDVVTGKIKVIQA